MSHYQTVTGCFLGVGVAGQIRPDRIRRMVFGVTAAIETGSSEESVKSASLQVPEKRPNGS
ncbi:MAG TPA: hypothetical protein PLE60_10815 [Candidatus Latescibacteria bacterium]|nr:hypothetical protein [Candidatus Latescibacterota bacterium]